MFKTRTLEKKVDSLIAWAVVAAVAALMFGLSHSQRGTGIAVVLFVVGVGFMFADGLNGPDRVMYYDHAKWSATSQGEKVDFCLFVNDQGKNRPCGDFSHNELQGMQAIPAERK
jgi:hypothetical protein